MTKNIYPSLLRYLFIFSLSLLFSQSVFSKEKTRCSSSFSSETCDSEEKDRFSTQLSDIEERAREEKMRKREKEAEKKLEEAEELKNKAEGIIEEQTEEHRDNLEKIFSEKEEKMEERVRVEYEQKYKRLDERLEKGKKQLEKDQKELAEDREEVAKMGEETEAIKDNAEKVLQSLRIISSKMELQERQGHSSSLSAEEKEVLIRDELFAKQMSKVVEELLDLTPLVVQDHGREFPIIVFDVFKKVGEILNISQSWIQSSKLLISVEGLTALFFAYKSVHASIQYVHKIIRPPFITKTYKVAANPLPEDNNKAKKSYNKHTKDVRASRFKAILNFRRISAILASFVAASALGYDFTLNLDRLSVVKIEGDLESDLKGLGQNFKEDLNKLSRELNSNGEERGETNRFYKPDFSQNGEPEETDKEVRDDSSQNGEPEETDKESSSDFYFYVDDLDL